MNPLRFLAASLIPLALTGCASIYTVATVDGPPRPYSGVRLDASIIADRIKPDADRCDLRYCDRYWWLYYPGAVGDMPWSALADTLLLPYTLTGA